MGSSRRHESIVPLSREHHFGLMLCLRIRQGLRTRGADADWLRKKSEDTAVFFDSNLAQHFKAEEEVVFPELRAVPSAAELLDDLVSEHRRLEALVEQLRLHTDSNQSPADLLKEFAETLEAHIRREERTLFPLYELQIPAERARAVGRALQARLGTGSEPRHPEALA